MESKTIGAATLGVAAVVGVALASFSPREAVVDQTKSSIILGSLPPLATVEVRVGPTMLGRLPDGGPTVLAEHRLADGGRVWMRVGGGKGCVRKPVGAVLPCGQGPSTLSWEDRGELNRFDASGAQPIVNSCEAVPCAVWYGEDADLNELDLLSSPLGLGVP